jgi:NAD(P)-dependent dehydrogenase (short-subunit alcohol dehydrogenase family)
VRLETEERRNRIPAKRHGTPEEVADLIAPYAIDRELGLDIRSDGGMPRSD